MLVALESMKNEVNIYNIYEDYNKFNVIIDEDMQISEKFDELFNNNLSGFKNEVVIKENGKHSKFNEIKKIYEKGEKKIGKIIFKENGKKISGSAFFLEIDNNKFKLPFKRVLFTNNHVLNEEFLNIIQKYILYLIINQIKIQRKEKYLQSYCMIILALKY